MGRRMLLISLMGLLGITAIGCTKDSTPPPPGEPLSAMTWNIYLGADLTPVLTAPSPGDIPGRAAVVWAQIQATDFPGRAVQIANVVATHKPHVIGLQEVSLYRIQSPGDAAFGGTVPADSIVLDYLDILMKALGDAGVNYEVISTIANFDVEVPMFAGAQLDDIRLTDRDVILVRKDIPTREVAQQNFTATAQLMLGGTIIPFKRGWNSVVLDFFGEPIRIVNTHLEGQSFADVQQAQAQELVDATQNETRPVLFLGDFNSDANGLQTPTYDLLVGAGWHDLWGTNGGYTCCQAPDLMNAPSSLTQRIDFLFANGVRTPSVDSVAVIGMENQPMWPSDHAGMVAILSYARTP